MKKVMAFAIAVTIAVFGFSVSSTARESKIQDNHDQHHKAVKTSSKSDKRMAVKKKRAVSKKRPARVKKRGVTARKG